MPSAFDRAADRSARITLRAMGQRVTYNDASAGSSINARAIFFEEYDPVDAFGRPIGDQPMPTAWVHRGDVPEPEVHSDTIEINGTAYTVRATVAANRGGLVEITLST